MKKQDIKKDLIRDKIISGIHYLSDNASYVWGALGISLTLIVVASFVSSGKNKKMLESNNLLGSLQNKIIHDTLNQNDSVLTLEFEELLSSSSLSKESYNQAFVYLVNKSLESNNKEKILLLLENNNFNSNDEMLNSFVSKLKADIASDENKVSDAIKYYKEAINIVPSYDLMVSYSVSLIELYIEESDLNSANSVFDRMIKLTKDVKNLPRTTQNNIDFIEYKLKQLNK
ncbi:MAG: hypothetical protein CMG66_06745 [Candidatus Marinimicrobia bacterium]|nr:hypothetical protein [Candidatus Neomarinimicrobiota bacterium]|tara:strand:- start:9957 stop:10646 length:690 start_codon:yes stop_codon:yes gene_type:complete